MRKYMLLAVVAVVLAGCRGTQAYSAEDLSQVRQAYAALRPIYLHFELAYRLKDTRGILQNFHREQSACRVVDDIDRRDTIDPNVQLFQASIELDNMCNAIESAYAFWAPKHGYPYDKSIVAYRPIDVFVGADAGLLKMSGYMRHPAALA